MKPAQPYGRSPALQCLPDLKAHNEHTRIELTVKGDCGTIHLSLEQWKCCPACEQSLHRALGGSGACTR